MYRVFYVFTIVGIAPLHRVKTPSSLTIRANALKTLV